MKIAFFLCLTLFVILVVEQVERAQDRDVRVHPCQGHRLCRGVRRPALRDLRRGRRLIQGLCRGLRSHHPGRKGIIREMFKFLS